MLGQDDPQVFVLSILCQISGVSLQHPAPHHPMIFPLWVLLNPFYLSSEALLLLATVRISISTSLVNKLLMASTDDAVGLIIDCSAVLATSC